jgi:hypothetical protein
VTMASRRSRTAWSEAGIMMAMRILKAANDRFVVPNQARLPRFG